MANAKKKRKAAILGVGLDSDGHKRITTGPNFALVMVSGPPSSPQLHL